MDAWAVNASLQASWKRALGSSLDTVLNSDFEVIGFKAGGALPLFSAGADELRETLRPIGFEAAVFHVTQCLTTTASRDRATADKETLIGTMAMDVQSYPADIVATVFEDWRKTEKFWPTIAEILQRCEKLARPRRDLLAIASGKGTGEALRGGMRSIAQLSAERCERQRRENLERMVENHKAGITPAPPPKREPAPIKPNHMPPEHAAAYHKARADGHSPIEAQRIADETLIRQTAAA